MIKMNTFLTLYDRKEKEGKGEEFIKEHIKNEYVPFEKKADIAKAIVDASCWTVIKEKGKPERRTFHIDSVAKYMLTCMSIVELYTDIERQKNDSKMLDDFNRLNGTGILDMIVANIDQREIKEFNMVIQITQDDLFCNEYEPHAFIKSQVERFGELIGTTLKPVVDRIDMSKIQDVMMQLTEDDIQ